MSKKEITDNVWEKLHGELDGLTKNAVKTIVDSVFREVIEITDKSGKCRVVGFGSFTKYHRAAREASHPQTLQKIQIAACNSVKFSAGREFKDEVQD